MKTYKLLTFFSLFLLTFSTSFAQKMKVEDIIAKHLDSIGTKEKRTEIKNQMIIGTANYKVLRSSTFAVGKSSGNAVFISEADKFYFGMKFDSLGYPIDEIVYDGESVNTAYVTPGQRSTLSYFILNNRDIIKENLFGGCLSKTWFLLDFQSQNAKLESGGTKKIDGKETYLVKYSIKGNSPLTVKLYFDAKTFQHIRSEYRRVFPAPFTREQTASASQVETVHQLIEDFSDFKEVNGLTLPHSYQINLLFNGKATDELEWKFEFSDFRYNQKIDPATFKEN